MSFVPESYVAIVDQLLTALTGGQSRESHRFFPGTDGYGFDVAFDDILTETIRVVGASSDQFDLFVTGRDWYLDLDAEKIRFLADSEDTSLPASGAFWPDEGSTFFVSYYHRKSHESPITDRNVGSVTRTLAEGFSRELAVLQKQLGKVYDAAYLESATGNSLDKVVALLGLSRKKGDYASGTIRFYRDTPAPGDVFIPAGTRISTALSPAVAFVTVADATLRRDQLVVEVSIRAVESGMTGVVQAETITVLNRSVHGVNGVINAEPTLLGGTPESDDELRQRAATAMEKVGGATPGALFHEVATRTGIKQNKLKLVEEFRNSPGLVKLFIAAEGSEDLAVNVSDAILATRPAGVRVTHNLESFLPGDSDAGLTGSGGRDDGTTPLSEEEGFAVKLTANVLVYPYDPNLTEKEQAQMAETIRKTLNAYVDNSEIGQVLVYNRMVADIMAISGINDIELDIGSASGGETGKSNLQLPVGQRGMFDDPKTDITVIFSGAPVVFDIKVQMTLKAGHGQTGAEDEIRQRLRDFFDTSPAQLSGGLVISTLTPSDAYDIQAGGVSMTITYSRTGVTLYDTAESIDISGEERAVMGTVTMTANEE